MSQRFLRLLLIAGSIFLCAPFWISTAVLIPAYIDVSHYTNMILNARMFMTLLWYSGFSIGIPAAIMALCARTEATRLLAVSGTIFGVALIAMGNAQRQIFGYAVRGGVGTLILHSLIPIALWVISIVLARKATLQNLEKNKEQ